MKKLSFKTKETKRKTTILLEIDNEEIEVIFTTPTASNVGQDKLIIDMFKSMLRLNKDKEKIFNLLIDNLDIEQITEIIGSVNEELYLKKK